MGPQTRRRIGSSSLASVSHMLLCLVAYPSRGADPAGALIGRPRVSRPRVSLPLTQQAGRRFLQKAEGVLAPTEGRYELLTRTNEAPRGASVIFPLDLRGRCGASTAAGLNPNGAKVRGKPTVKGHIEVNSTAVRFGGHNE